MDTHKEYFNYLKTRSRAGHLYRKYWLYPILARNLRGRALDVGCGIGDMLAFRPQTTGVDINPYSVEYCKSISLDAHLMKDGILPFKSKSFDSVLLDNVLEHIEMPELLIKEVTRVLCDDNLVLVGVPGLLGYRSDVDHKVFYDEHLLKGFFDRLGFECIKVFHTPLFRSDFLSSTVRQYCIYGVFTSSQRHIAN